MKFKRVCLILTVVVSSTMLSVGARNTCKAQMREPMTAKLLARRMEGDKDNYTKAAFSFKYGVNGDEGLSLTRNHWDLLFGNEWAKIGNERTRDTFSVQMVVGDCSRIKDLGEHNWSDDIKLPDLPAYEKAEREAGIPAVIGHMYLVHTKQWDFELAQDKKKYIDVYSDYYTLFRVESLEPLTNVTISWKLISDIKKIPVGDPKPSSGSTKSKP